MYKRQVSMYNITRFAWAGGTCLRFAWAGRIFSPVILILGFQVPPISFISQVTRSKRILKKILGFQIPPIFFISHLAPLKRILKFFLGFQIPPIFCKCISTSKRILKFFWGFQIPPIFCISQLARLGSSLKKNPKNFKKIQAGNFHYERKKKKFQSSVWRVRDQLLRPEKKDTGGKFSLRAEKKKVPVVCLAGPSKRILIFFLGFQIPPIFCISQLARLGSSLKKNPKFFLGFQILAGKKATGKKKDTIVSQFPSSAR